MAHKQCNWEVVINSFLLILTDFNFVKIGFGKPQYKSWFQYAPSNPGASRPSNLEVVNGCFLLILTDFVFCFVKVGFGTPRDKS